LRADRVVATLHKWHERVKSFQILRTAVRP
jgi:hypothetical protein